MSALPFPDPPLADGVVMLRAPRRADIPQKFAGFADPECQRFSWPFVEPCTEADVRRHFEEQESARLIGTDLDLVIADPDDPARLWGATSIYDVHADQARAAIGYWLAPHARGRGLATRTVRLLARWAFERLALARLELTCAPDNVTSQRVALRCGFVREGVLRSHIWFKGSRRDTVMFSLLPGELVD